MCVRQVIVDPISFVVIYFLTLNDNSDNADNERKICRKYETKTLCTADSHNLYYLLQLCTSYMFKSFSHKFRPMDRDTFVHRRQLQAWALAR